MAFFRVKIRWKWVIIPFCRCSKILGEAGKQEILQQMLRKFKISNRLPNRYFPENCRWVNPGLRIRNSAQGIRITVNDWNSDSKFHWQGIRSLFQAIVGTTDRKRREKNGVRFSLVYTEPEPGRGQLMCGRARLQPIQKLHRKKKPGGIRDLRIQDCLNWIY